MSNKVKVQMLEPKEGIRTIDTTGGQTIAKPTVIGSIFILIDEWDKPYILTDEELPVWEIDGSIVKGDTLYKAEIVKRY